MRKLNLIILIITLLLVPIFNASAQEADKYTGALLWKVSGNGLSQPSYILGTHHLAHVDFVDSIAGLNDVMNSAEQIVGELLLADQVAMQARLQQASMMQPGETYRDMLSEQDFQALDNGMKTMVGVGMNQLGQLKPGMLSMLYTVALYSKLHPEFNPMLHEAIDAYVQRLGSESGKEIFGLETEDDQIYILFDAEPLKDQAEALVCTVKNSDMVKEQLEKLNEYYRSGNLKGMYDLSFNSPNDPCKISPLQKSIVLESRNNKWLEKLPRMMGEKPTLIAVGALHLAGQEGLLYQLAEKGYNIEPVR